jgi:hypothetical protein
MSGNYLMHVYDFQSGIELFSMPFFVTEDVGTFNNSVETIYNSGIYGEAEDLISGEYLYPDFVQFPQFDLSYHFVQNRFLAQSKSPQQINFVEEGQTTFRFLDSQLFPSYFDFNLLNLSRLNLQNPAIYNYQPGFTPERVYLFPDYFNFSTQVNNGQQNGLGYPQANWDAKYAEVNFTFDAGFSDSNGGSVYLIGDFNQWTVNDASQLTYNSKTGRFDGRALIKQGSYSYKYVSVKAGRINTLLLSESITGQPQEYIGFVYYQDPQYLIDRLLNVKVFRTN